MFRVFLLPKLPFLLLSSGRKFFMLVGTLLLLCDLVLLFCHFDDFLLHVVKSEPAKQASIAPPVTGPLCRLQGSIFCVSFVSLQNITKESFQKLVLQTAFLKSMTQTVLSGALSWFIHSRADEHPWVRHENQEKLNFVR